MKKLTIEEFINKARLVHGNKDDYSKVVYVNNRTKICIICPIHGEFWQTPNAHLCGQGCPNCGNEIKGLYKKSPKIDFNVKAKKIHGDKYDYSEAIYVNEHTKLCLICPIHGKFWITPNCHLKGQGCPECGGVKKMTTETFIKKAMKIHGEKNDYSEVKYVNNRTKVCIICPKHGKFWQTPANHLRGQGCPLCINSLLELKMKTFLVEKKINFIQQYSFDWLRNKRLLTLDFYLPYYNIAIECQGRQHFEQVSAFGGEESFKKTLALDLLKSELCSKHNVKIIYFSNLEKTYQTAIQNKIVKKIYNDSNICFNFKDVETSLCQSSQPS